MRTASSAVYLDFPVYDRNPELPAKPSVVPKKRKTTAARKNRYITICCLAAGFCALGIGLASVIMYPVQLGYQVAQLEKETIALEKENLRMAKEIAAYKSLERVEKIAVSDLRMLSPSNMIPEVTRGQMSPRGKTGRGLANQPSNASTPHETSIPVAGAAVANGD